jgi:hypothetical protein
VEAGWSVYTIPAATFAFLRWTHRSLVASVLGQTAVLPLCTIAEGLLQHSWLPCRGQERSAECI